jgi:acyl carrier protein
MTNSLTEHTHPGIDQIMISDRTPQLRQAVFGNVMGLPASEWPNDSADLFEMGLDSMTILRILVVIEEELGVTLSERELTPQRVQSIEALEGWIREVRGA